MSPPRTPALSHTDPRPPRRLRPSTILTLVSLVVLVVGPGVAWSQPTPPRGEHDAGYPVSEYLEGYQGPYRGMVLDHDTKQPIPGAVVVAVWHRIRILPFQRVREFHAAREALTGADGSFVLDARDVEEPAPARTTHPFFIVFTPGYGPFPWSAIRKTDAGGYELSGFQLFRGRGSTIELRRQDREQRRRALFNITPFSWSPDWPALLPHFFQALNTEHKQLGLQPIPERTHK